MSRQVLPGDPAWLKKAFDDLGLKETPGKGSNPRVLEMYRLAKHPEVKDDAVAWCSAAMNAWMAECNIRPTYSLAARSWATWGSPSELKRGCICVFRRGTGYQGHVALLLEDQGSSLLVLGGNQSDSVSITRMRKSALITARWPRGIASSRTVQSASVAAVSFSGSETVGKVNEVLDQGRDTVSEMSMYFHWAEYALIAISIISLGFLVWQFVRKYYRPDSVEED